MLRSPTSSLLCACFLCASVLCWMAPAPPAAAADKPAERASAAVAPAAAEADVMAGKVFADILDAVGQAIQRTLGPPGSLAPGQQVDPEMILPHYIAEYTRQFRPLLRIEMQLVDSVCQPTPAERQVILRSAIDSLRQTVKQYADLQVKLEQDGYASRRTIEWPNPRQLLLAAVSSTVERTLPAEKARRYQAELEARIAAQRRATIGFAITRLDRDLLLSPEQRTRLLAVLEADWQPDWALILPSLPYYDRESFPLPLADDHVTPILSEAQKQIWGRWRKREERSRGWTGFGFLHPLEEDGGTELDEPPAEGGAAAAESQGGKP